MNKKISGRIIEIISNIYKVEVNEKIYEAVPRGVFRKEEKTPVVGDFVEIEVIDETTLKAVIISIDDRSVYIKRPKIANITKLILVVSMKNPKPDLLLLDKQLAFAEFMGVKPVILLNKIDLVSVIEIEEIKCVYEKIGYKVILNGNEDVSGINELNMELKGEVSAFSGNSGVGKSTLINKIFNLDLTEEGEISLRNKRGKNTTTAIKLYKIMEDSYIADTPGFSTFSVEEIPYRELVKYFREMIEFSKECKYTGCNHIKEADCGIKKVVENDIIDKLRYERFVKIYEELKNKEENKKW